MLGNCIQSDSFSQSVGETAQHEREQENRDMPELCQREICTGCTACASVCPKGCITMVADEDGFLYPSVSAEICIGCGLCQKVCPVVTPPQIDSQQPKAYAAYSKDEAVRRQSSSGGIFTEIAKAALKKGGVVYGAAYNELFDILHICVESEDDLDKLRGAKYAQSDLQGIFSEVKSKLNSGRLVLFSGTPCQVAGLKSYLCKGYDNLLTVDFVCHSVPSPMAWREYVKYRSQQDNNGCLPKTINLRSKETGWSRYKYSNLFQYENGTTHIAKNGESLYMKLFVGGYINREACANCHFKGYSRISDMTLGDFWGIWDIAPEMDDNKGTSVLLVQSNHGAELLAQIGEQLVLKEVTLEQTSRENTAMLRVSKSNERRRDVLTLIREGRIAACKAWFETPKLTFMGKLIRKIKRHLGKRDN